MLMKVEINAVASSHSSPVYGGSGPRVIARVEGGDADDAPCQARSSAQSNVEAWHLSGPRGWSASIRKRCAESVCPIVHSP